MYSLSPLFFVLAIEPLADSIRTDPSIEGFADKRHHKLPQSMGGLHLPNIQL